MRRARLRDWLLLLVAAHPSRLPPELVYEQVKGSGKPGFMPALDAMLSYPLRDRLPEVACPTFIVWGDKDRLVPVKDASEFERLIDDSRKVVYKDTGHTPMFERPARFNADVHAFLQEQPGEEQPFPQPRSFAT
jgi:pimeloyl-ACP methyl ester carboxylesterase